MKDEIEFKNEYSKLKAGREIKSDKYLLDRRDEDHKGKILKGGQQPDTVASAERNSPRFDSGVLKSWHSFMTALDTLGIGST